MLLFLPLFSRSTSFANASSSSMVSTKIWLLVLFLLATSTPSNAGRMDHPRRSDVIRFRSLSRVIATAPGSKPPSCLNKCDSCTPCQAVQAVQDAPETVVTDIGSRPPSCQNKCNRCIPCQAVQVPTPDPKDDHGKEKSKREMPDPAVQQQGEDQGGESGGGGGGGGGGALERSALYSNYKPKGWRCQCGNKLFNP